MSVSEKVGTKLLAKDMTEELCICETFYKKYLSTVECSYFCLIRADFTPGCFNWGCGLYMKKYGINAQVPRSGMARCRRAVKFCRRPFTGLSEASCLRNFT